MSSPTRPAPAQPPMPQQPPTRREPDGPGPAGRDSAGPEVLVLGEGAAAVPRRSSRLVLGVTLVAGLVLGLGAARLLAGGAPAVTPTVARLDLPGLTDGEPAAVAPAPPPPVQGDLMAVEDATSPEAAVRGFLTAEALGDFAASYAFLGPDDLATHPTPAAWVAAHGELPPITGFTVEQVDDGSVTTVTALRSTLDQVMGLTPARSRTTWQTVEVEGSFRVDHGRSTAMALYPSDAGVPAAVARWAEARQECRDEEPAVVLLGAPALAEQLCGTSGEVAVGEAGTLADGTTTTPLLNAYGPEVYTWARVVDLREPIALQAVAAPIADAWQVIAVLPAP